MAKFMRKFRKSDYWIYLAVAILVVLGVIMVGSATIGDVATSTASAIAEEDSVSSGISLSALTTIAKQIIFNVIGLIAMIIVFARYQHSLLQHRSTQILIILMYGSLLACLLFSATNGSHAWIKIGSFSLQPSEFCKIGTILVLSFIFTKYPVALKPKSNQYYRSIPNGNQIRIHDRRRYRLYCYVYPILFVLIEAGIIIGLQNDTGSALVLVMISCFCFFAASEKDYGPWQKIALLAVIAVILLSPLIIYGMSLVLQDYQLSRITSWLDPLGDPYNTSAQLVNALIAIANGGISGVGLLNSTQKFGYIPESQTDFITSVILEELGIFGLALIIIPYGIIIFRLIKHAIDSKNTRSTIILVGIASYFFLHLFINLGGVSGLIPMTGIPLLFVSQGGSSIVTSFIAIGIAQAIIATDKKREQDRQYTE